MGYGGWARGRRRGCSGARISGRVAKEHSDMHKVYSAIVKAVERGRLGEPFTKEGFRSSCPGFGHGTYNAFLHKHRKGNPGGQSELFEKVEPGRFKLLRPLRYGL